MGIRAFTELEAFARSCFELSRIANIHFLGDIGVPKWSAITRIFALAFRDRRAQPGQARHRWSLPLTDRIGGLERLALNP
jgi:uncharacterized protein YjiS (DUF1127 family)